MMEWIKVDLTNIRCKDNIKKDKSQDFNLIYIYFNIIGR